MADGSLLGHPVSGSSGIGAVDDGQGHTIGKTVTYQMTAEAARINMEEFIANHCACVNIMINNLFKPSKVSTARYLLITASITRKVSFDHTLIV